ncbi:Protein of unknown function, partial [Cotesia congregata]
LRKRWNDNEKRVRVVKKPYTPPVNSSKLLGDAKENMDDEAKKCYYKILAVNEKTPPKTKDKTNALHDGGIDRGNQVGSKTPPRAPLTIPSKSDSYLEGSDAGVITRDRMQNIKRVAWKRRMESRYLNLREEVNELKRSKNENNNKNENNEDKTKSVKLKETIVIENGEQITTIDDVVFTSTEFVTIAKQPTMKKRVSCLVPVVWTQEVIQKKYLNPQLCYHFQKHRKINYETGGKDDPNFHSKPWLGRRCTELRNVLNQKNKVHQAPPDG